MKVSKQRLSELWIQWNRSDKVERFGQYFMNREWPGVPGYTEIFYQRDDMAAFNTIYENHVEEK